MKNEKLHLKIRSFFLRYWPILYILGVWFIFSSPYFLQHKVPFPSTYQVNHFEPWRAYEKYWSAVKNDAMPDIIDQIYPWRKLTIESWRTIGLPVWNPYNFAGNPHLANYQSAVFSPFNLLFLILPFIDAWSLLVLLQPLIAGVGTYAFLRSLRISKIGALIGGVTFMFSGFIVTWMAYGTLSLAIACLPWALFSFQRFFTTHRKIYLILLSCIIPTSFFSGHFQTSIYFFLFLLGYIMFFFYMNREKKKFIAVILSIFIGCFISLLQILPSIEFYNYSVRSSILLTTGGIPWYYLVTSFAPDFFGNPVTRNNWFGYYAEWASFTGIIPLLLSGFRTNWKKEHIFFIGSGCVALLLATGSLQPLIVFLHIPVLSTSIPSRAIVLFSFSIAILSGIGFDNLFTFIQKRSVKHVGIPMSFIAVLLFGVVGLMFFLNPTSHANSVVALKNTVIPIVLFGISVFLVFLSFRFKKTLPHIGFILILCVSFDSLRFATKWMPFDPRNLVFPDVPVISAIKKNIGNGRIFGNLGAQVETYYGISSIEGYDPLYVERVGELLMSAGSGKYDTAERSVAKINRLGKYTEKVLDLLGVNLIFQPIVDTGQGWAFPVWSKPGKYALIYQDDRFQLYRNVTALPRAKVYYSYEVIPEKKKEVERLFAESFDITKKVLLEEQPVVQNSIEDGKNNVVIQSYQPNNIVIEVESNKPGLLFLSDTYYPNWRARVNGKKTKIYRADYALRAVEIPSGKSVIQFTYSFL